MLAPKLEVVKGTGGKNSVYNSVERFALDGLSDLIRVMMESVDDALFELSDKVDNDRERNMYFEAMREIRIKRDGLQKHFDYEMRQCFKQFVVGNTANVEIEDEDELTLVELDDLEDNIAIENMISRARPHFEDDLFAVSERLKKVLRREEIAEDENPLDPMAICESFHKASGLLDTDIQVKLIFYKLFERYVMNNLGHFYKEMNELFVRKGVLPEFRVDQERMKQTTQFMANRIKHAPPQAGPGAVTGPMTGAAGAVPLTEGNLFAALQQAVTTAGTVSGGVSAEGGYETAGYQPAGGIPAGATGGGFLSALSSLQTASFPDQPLTSIDPQNFKDATQQQLVAFRQANQHQVDAADSQTIDVVSMLFDFFFDDEALPAPIKVLIGRLQIPILKVAIIDKEFFNQKKHPARKLLDSISRAALGWGDNHADQKDLIGKIEEIVDFLINEFDQDLGVFEEAHINFENFLNDEAQEIEKAETQLRQQEQARDQRIQQAQEAAAEFIHKLTDRRNLSFKVTDFLETTWTSVLFNAYLSLGEDSNHWRNLKRISTTFVWSLIPKFREDERVKIIKTIPALLRALSKGMDLVKISTEVQNRIFQMLAQEHARIVKQTSKNIVTRLDDETVWPADNAARALAEAEGIDVGEHPDFEFSTDESGGIQMVEGEDVESITIISAAETSDVIEDLNHFSAEVKQGNIVVDEEIVLVSDEAEAFDLADQDGNDFMPQALALEIGDWVEFIESQSQTLVARLAWKSKVTGNFVFVNRQGHKVRNLTIQGFATELRAGRVKCIESSSVFDRAIYTIMSKMKH